MEKRRRPRALTLTLPDEHQPHLLFEGRRYTLRNLSEEGIGLWVPSPAPYGMKVGNSLSADLVIDNRIYSVDLQVVRESERVLGLKILHKSSELDGIFRRLLAPSFYAADLKPHAKSGSEDPAVGGPRLWYTGKPGVELVVWYHEFKKMVLSLQLIWSAKWVFRSQFQPTRSGYIGDIEGPSSDLAGQLEGIHIWAGKQIPESELMVVHESADTELVAQAAQFLTSVPHPLPGTLLWQFLETGEQVFLPENAFPKLKVA